MKRTAIVILTLISLGLLAGPAPAGSRNDFKVIQNAVKQSPAAVSEPGRDLKWFKVLIRDSRSGEAAVKITLPVALIELLVANSDSRHFKVRDDRCEIDLKAVWAALKKAGPLALVEIRDDGAVIKVWLE